MCWLKFFYNVYVTGQNYIVVQSFEPRLILSFLCFLEFPDYSWIKEIDNQPRLKILTSEYDFDL